MANMPFISTSAHSAREHAPLVHCITNYVTVEGCANAVLAVGGSPIMTDEPADVADITSICGSLVVNIGTLNKQTIEGMKVACARAAELGHPIVLDPVGAGASALRTQTACGILEDFPVTLVRGNMSEIKAIAGFSSVTKGVDVDPADQVTEETLAEAAAFARDFARASGCVVAITGPIDVIADAQRVFAVHNGTPMQGKVTGCGCMLSAISGAYAASCSDQLEAAVSAVVHMGLAGQIAQERLAPGEGTGTFRVRLMDALSTLDGEALAEGAKVQEVKA